MYNVCEPVKQQAEYDGTGSAPSDLHPRGPRRRRALPGAVGRPVAGRGRSHPSTAHDAQLSGIRAPDRGAARGPRGGAAALVGAADPGALSPGAAAVVQRAGGAGARPLVDDVAGADRHAPNARGRGQVPPPRHRDPLLPAHRGEETLFRRGRGATPLRLGPAGSQRAGSRHSDHPVHHRTATSTGFGCHARPVAALGWVGCAASRGCPCRRPPPRTPCTA